MVPLTGLIKATLNISIVVSYKPRYKVATKSHEVACSPMPAARLRHGLHAWVSDAGSDPGRGFTAVTFFKGI